MAAGRFAQLYTVSVGVCEHVQVPWLQDRIHGQGVAVFASGNRYEGSWDNGRIHGRGVPPQTREKHAKYAFSALHADSGV